MGKVRFSDAPRATIMKQPIVNGKFYVSSDTKEFFCDTVDGARIKISDIEILTNEDERTDMLAPLNKFYYVLETNKLWYYNTEWNMIGPSNPLTIQVNGTQLAVYDGSESITINITKSNIGLGNVPNVSTNNQTPTYTEATSLAKLASGEKLSVAFGKIAKAVSDLISHIGNKSNPHGVTKSQLSLGNVTNDKQIKGLSSGTTKGHVVIFGEDGYSVNDSGFTLGVSVPANAKFTDTLYTLPAATASALGGVKVGSNITLSSGVISLTKENVVSALGYTPPTTNTTYTNATTSKNGLMSSTDKTRFDNLYARIAGYAVTGGTTSAYTATIDGVTLKEGTVILLRFNATNVAGATLNINDLGAKPIYYKGAAIPASRAPVNAVLALVYDTTQVTDGAWHCVFSYDANTTYTNAGLGSGYGTCSTDESTTAKVVSLSSYTLVVNGIVSVKFTYAVPAKATMNINSKGAKNIFYKGTQITAGIIKAGDTVSFIYDGTQYHIISFDRDTVPTALKNPNALTLQFNGTTNKTYDGSSAQTLNITPAAIGAATSSHGTHVTFSTDAPKANGTASAGSASTVSRSDHVHPLQTSVSGNAGSATKLATARKINGVSFNGTADITIGVDDGVIS